MSNIIIKLSFEGSLDGEIVHEDGRFKILKKKRRKASPSRESIVDSSLEELVHFLNIFKGTDVNVSITYNRKKIREIETKPERTSIPSNIVIPESIKNYKNK